MKKLAIIIAAGALALVGCSKEEQPAIPESQTQVHVNVVDTLGLPNAGVTVIASQNLGSQTEQIGEEVTNAEGDVTFTLPENSTVAMGMWKQVEENADSPNYTWQYPFLVPVGGTSLTYVYQPNGTQCAVVKPGEPDPCPSSVGTVDPPATSTASPTPDAAQTPGNVAPANPLP